MKLKCQKSSELLNWTFSFWVRSRLCWQRIRERAEVKTLQMKKKTPKMQLLKGLEWTAQEWLRVYKRELQGRSKYNKSWGSNSPECTTVLGWGWIPWAASMRGVPKTWLAFTHRHRKWEKYLFLPVFCCFSPLFKFFASADVELTAAARGLGAAASARGSGDFQRIMKT